MEYAVRVTDFCAYYSHTPALKHINLAIPEKKIYAFIGPSGCGKTTLLRSINRLNDLVKVFSHTGEITVGETDIYALKDKPSVERLRRGIGMVFQQPNPLPMSIMQNMLLPIKEHLKLSNEEMTEMAIKNLKDAGLYDEVADRLHKAAMQLSGGQQQRLCIARALILNPSVILFDEPCSALDPISTFKIEELLTELKKQYTIIMVTHNMEQARRIADYTAFFYQGEIVEAAETENIFMYPEMELTQRYIRGVM